MIYKITKAKHRAWPIPIGLYWNKETMIRKVRLGFDATYNFTNDSDQFAVNKLFGLGYFPGNHMVDSARWGWRYNPTTRLFEYCFYCHLNKEVKYETVVTGNVVNGPVLGILFEPKHYIFLAWDGFDKSKLIGEHKQPHDHNKKLSYKLGPYFGGKMIAPHDMKIELKKV